MSGVRKEPPKLGAYFARMLATCPESIAAYGACVQKNVAGGTLERDCCKREFEALSRCFRQVRKR